MDEARNRVELCKQLQELSPVRNDPTKRISRLYSLLTLAKEEKKVKTKADAKNTVSY